ncbi:putative alanine--tRNA ligase [Aspergillus clavatus NRRL 1]|uniref:Alanyl-tRNA synthetase, putative n=1 Tax=Aspergillus clavatus (strain ATCC 1007 / CBS 513.65 / DSM 816 / NCTC 3887 / NRRL 1 / QM 1276 / 107) TaxID=344612 RepID=A1C4L8_ASPCL|nr:alanyl-tRNA synthetase, putative [Aspergillus clavatus NRRL 1]EAW15358.1 alanyl-tRNA synthetase, putative [Aspergillus clavatus NRRL 1]
MGSTARTVLAFQHDAKLYTFQTIVTAIHPFSALEASNQQLFKQGTDADHVIVTEQTIFHPQGGGQPSDEGHITGPLGAIFTVAAVRMDAVRNGQVLHFGHFNDTSAVFTEGATVEQTINADKRVFYSRLHTAGHVLGAAVKHLLAKEVEGLKELKASHFPESAACEFQGLIDGKWKEPVQRKVDELIAAKLPVQVEWWDEEEFRRRGMERLIPDQSLVAPGEKFRVVNIVGADVYPCGGTHVDTTDQCGTTTVRKITRKTGNSKVSYTVNE